MRPKIWATAVCLWLVVGGVVCAQERSVSFMRLGTDIIQKKLAAQPASAETRADTLRRLFKSAGCGDRIIEQPVPQSNPNILCSVPGTGNSLIVVGASLDYIAKGDEEGLRWGDLAMLPLLAESLSAVVTRHSIVFVAFAGKNGAEGAKAYLERLSPQQRANVDAVAALDELGRTQLVYSVPGTRSGVDIHTGRPAQLAKESEFHPEWWTITRPIVEAAQRWSVDVPNKTTDMGAPIVKPFHRAHLPVITFTSPAWVVRGYVGDEPIRDYVTKLDLPSYEQTYLFLSAYLLFLDRDMGQTAPVPVENAAQVIRDTRLRALQTTVQTRQADLARTLPAPEPVSPPTTTVAASGVPATAPATAPVADSTTPVFRTTARLVQVDVVATDKSGRPITGLKREDFTVLQDGQPQNARVFEAHVGNPAAQTGAKVESAEAKAQQPHYLNSYTNAPAPSGNQSWTIILFDMLNTPTQDQQTARNQLKKLAEQVPAGQPVALFAMTSRLTMLQSFTTDTSSLMAAVKNLELWHSQVLTTEAERQHQVGDAAYRAKTSTEMAIPAQANVPPSMIADFQSDTANRFLLSTRDMESLRLDQRAMFTLDAFEGISRALAGYPGRKNLIWLSGNFPMRIDPSNTISDKWRYSTNYMDHLTRTVTLLSQSRVAVYPVDIRGMQIRGVDISTSTAQSTAFVGASTGTAVGNSTDKTSSLLADQTFTGANERETMMEVAEQTGGRAFINTNDFKDAILRAIDDGSSYYTLAYTPDNKDDKPEYHRIEVKLNRSDAKLSYRRGYYSHPEVAAPKVGLAALQAALQPGMPPSTMLLFSAALKPPDASHKAVQLDYVISPNNVTLADAPGGGKHIVIDCMAVAFDREGKEVAHASDTLDGTLPANAVEAQLRHGLPASQELQLKPGVYNIRVGVQDRASQSIGTVSVPVVVQ